MTLGLGEASLELEVVLELEPAPTPRFGSNFARALDLALGLFDGVGIGVETISSQAVSDSELGYNALLSARSRSTPKYL